jgi:hypothetical protein
MASMANDFGGCLRWSVVVGSRPWTELSQRRRQGKVRSVRSGRPPVGSHSHRNRDNGGSQRGDLQMGLARW